MTAATSAVPPIMTTDVYPTRYAAFDNPGTVVRFEAREDGMYRHCREDSPYTRDLTIVESNAGMEAIVYFTPGVYAEVVGNGRTKAGVRTYAVKVQRDGRGSVWHNPRVEGLEVAESILLDFLTGAWDPFADGAA